MTTAENDRPRPRRRKRRAWFVGLAALACIGAIAAAGATHEPPLPRVTRDRLVIGTVETAPMKRQVRGPGRLVPRRVRWVTALVAGRVEKVIVEAGDAVGAESAIVVLANPDVELAALEAAHQASAAQAELVNLAASLHGEALAQRGSLSKLALELESARRGLEADEALAVDGLVAPLELARARSQVRGLETRIALEQERRTALKRAAQSRERAQRDDVARLDDIARFRADQRDALTVRAEAEGVVQELSVEEGRWVTPGQPLAKIACTGELVAEIAIDQAAARELAAGQPATIDTRSAEVRGRVERIDPAVIEGAVHVRLSLDEPLPDGARLDQAVDGVIDIETLPPTLVLERPASVGPDAEVQLFKLSADGSRAAVTTVRTGKASFDRIQILAGLAAGDRVILSRLDDLDHAESIAVD